VRLARAQRKPHPIVPSLPVAGVAANRRRPPSRPHGGPDEPEKVGHRGRDRRPAGRHSPRHRRLRGAGREAHQPARQDP